MCVEVSICSKLFLRFQVAFPVIEMAVIVFECRPVEF